MTGLSLVLSLFFLPEIKAPTRNHDTEDNHLLSISEMAKEFDARKVFKPMIYPNVLFTVSRKLHMVLFRVVVNRCLSISRADF